MLLSSDASDNLLLFVTVEGPVVTAVDWFTGSYIISKGARFLRPFSTQEWNVLKAGGWDISVQWPCVLRIPSAWPSNKMESTVNVTTHAPRCSSNSSDLPWLMDIATKVNPCLTLTHSWPVRSPQPLPVTACITCREHWHRAASCQPREATWDWSLVWSSQYRKPSCHVQALRPTVSCNTICPVNTVDGDCASDQWD